MELSGLITELEENRNELLAESMEKYMQDKFRFLGIRGPKRTELYKKYFPTARKTKVIDWNFIKGFSQLRRRSLRNKKPPAMRV